MACLFVGASSFFQNRNQGRQVSKLLLFLVFVVNTVDEFFRITFDLIYGFDFFEFCCSITWTQWCGDKAMKHGVEDFLLVLDAVVRLNRHVSISGRRFAVDVECEFFVDTFTLCVQKPRVSLSSTSCVNLIVL
jgi:hypothetical protein